MKLCTRNTLQLHNCKIDVISNESQILGSPWPQMKCYAQNKSHRPQQNNKHEESYLSGQVTSTTDLIFLNHNETKILKILDFVLIFVLKKRAGFLKIDFFIGEWRF